MFRNISLKALIPLIFLAANSFGQQLMPYVDGRVTSVIDGDTLIITTSGGKEVRLRLQGVNAPEREQPFGPEARQRLVAKVLNKDVRAEFTKVDNLKRVLAKVIFDGTDIGEEQLRDGFGWYYTHFANELSDEDRDTYKQAVNEAKTAGKGLWSDKSPVSPLSFRTANKIDESRDMIVGAGAAETYQIIGSRRTGYYYRPTCTGYKGVPKKDRVTFPDEPAAISGRYKLARGC
ncbi:MAG TPA: thermonuclease family protein [Pyrinomonadaceae bacterium]|nr:thermonuclease family protein [Pyrinomonadaceae bacterium]